MGAAFEGELPDTVFAVIKPGDVLLVQTMDFTISWLIMYFTSSEISHVASFVGNKEIIHSTLSGVEKEHIASLYDDSTRILPVTWPMRDSQRDQWVKLMEMNIGRRYGWLAVSMKFLRIISARDWPYFRWRFFADFAFSIIMLDLALSFILWFPFASTLIPVYLAVIVVNYFFWKIKPLQFNEWTGKPCDMVGLLQRAGGTFLFDAYYIRQHKEKKEKSSK